MENKIKGKTALEWKSKGNEYCESKKYKKAIGCFKKVIKIEPQNIEAWSRMAEAYKKLKKYRDSLQCYNELVRIDSGNFDDWMLKMAEIYEKMEKYKDAINCCNELIKINPRNIDAWSEMGLAYYLSKDFKKYKECTKKIFEIDPEREKAAKKAAADFYQKYRHMYEG